jgi:hypothetical protein
MKRYDIYAGDGRELIIDEDPKGEWVKYVDWFQSMQKLDMKDGDVVVLKCAMKLSPSTYKSIKEAVQEMLKGFGFDVYVIPLEDGMDIGVLRKERA